jgi:hypothetical protein
MCSALISNFRAIAVATALNCTVAATHAQASSQPVRVDLPFSFEVGSSRFAPGRYEFSRPMENLLAVHGDSTTGFALGRNALGMQPSEKGKVVFRKCGDKYRLAQVWTAGDANYIQCAENEEDTPFRHCIEVAVVEPIH